MKEFGWTIEYTLNLTYPVFLDLFNLIRRVRLDAAIDEFYTPYGAAKFGGKCSKALFDGRGSMFVKNALELPKNQEEVTPQMIERANERFQKIMEQRRIQAAEIANRT